MRHHKIFVIWTLLLLMANGILIFAQKNISVETRKILFLNSYHPGFRWSDSISRGIIHTFRNENVELYTEYIDAKHFGQTKFKQTADFIRSKYSTLKFEGVIVSDNDALDFAIKYGDLLFPSIPVIFCGISGLENYSFENTRFYGFTDIADPYKTLALISSIFPDAQKVLVIADNTRTGILEKQSYRNITNQFPHLELDCIENIDVDSILAGIKNNNKADIIALNTISQDKYGNVFDFVAFQKQIGQISPVPIISSGEPSVGRGIIGGITIKGYDQGVKAATMMIDLLTVHPSSHQIKHINRSKEVTNFDYRVLKQFGINKKKLPKNSVILHKPITRYLPYIKLLSIISLALIFVIAILSFNIRKRKKAEKKVRQQILEIQDQNAQLEESYQLLGEMNSELEETNAQLHQTNESLVEAKKKSEESERLKSSFLANMSHEIRTPLNAIVGFSSLLIDLGNDSEKRNNFINIINSNSESLLTLIDDILDLSKIEASQLSLHLEMIQVADIFFEMNQLLNLRNKNGIQIYSDPNAMQNALTLYTDKVRIKQIFTNLLTNALKFTEKGFIELGYHLDSPGEITFYVSDSGIGIDEHFQKTIFDRFTKFENHDKLYPGTGLGLAITKRLVEMLGGKIWLQSNIGEGSTFFFTHPLPA